VCTISNRIFTVSSLTHTLSLSHTHTLSTLSKSLFSLSLTHSVSLSIHTLSKSIFTISLSLSLSLPYPKAFSQFLSLSLSLSLSLYLIQKHFHNFCFTPHHSQVQRRVTIFCFLFVIFFGQLKPQVVQIISLGFLAPKKRTLFSFLKKKRSCCSPLIPFQSFFFWFRIISASAHLHSVCKSTYEYTRAHTRIRSPCTYAYTRENANAYAYTRARTRIHVHTLRV
jgi:hypothetical protein